MNALLKSPIAAVSPKVNTTREDIKGILCVDNCQMMFTDCPGILESHRRRKFCSPLVNTAWKAYDEADVCLFVLDAVKRPDATLFRIVRKLAGAPPFAPESDAYNHPAGSYGNGDQHQEGLRFNDQDDIDELMDGEESDVKDEFGIDDDIYTSVQQETRKPVALVLNKIDLVEHKKWVKSRTREMKNHGTFADVFYTSAKHGIGFKPMLEFLKTMAKPGMWVYPPNMLTTMSQVQVVEQMVRTYIYCWFNKELPYRVGQKVIGWTVAENGSLIIEMELYVRNDKAAKVICGIQGRIVKQLQKNVSHRLSKMWNEPVFLYVQVKVKALL
ncbi:small GTP-binding protein domain containing protein [Babesia divergens]|uniref:Small GTP-binding protein domain containing protein n=1 Tax=Babesia divergens TaxID=32595 RepID=A0AAD9G712_BABDI|nr:small GTP-binding protein domain containing protein [Babesia divergens]